jgi:hypothetical protein
MPVAVREGGLSPPAPDPPFVGDRVAWSYEPDHWRRHLVMIGSGVFVAIALLLAAIAWIFRQPNNATCRANFVCLININAGLVAL